MGQPSGTSQARSRLRPPLTWPASPLPRRLIACYRWVSGHYSAPGRPGQGAIHWRAAFPDWWHFWIAQSCIG